MALCKGCVRYHDAESFLPGSWCPDLEQDEDDPGDGRLEIAEDYFDWEQLWEIGANNRQKGAYSFERHDPIDETWMYDAELKLDSSDHWTLILEHRRDLVLGVLQDPSSVFWPYICRHHESSSPDLSKELKTQVNRHPRPWWPEDLNPDLSYLGPVRRCAYCPTEVRLQIRKISPVKRYSGHLSGYTRAIRHATYEVVVTRMVDLGPLYSPHCREWQALTRPVKKSIFESDPWAMGTRKGIFERHHRGRIHKAEDRAFEMGLMDHHLDMLADGIIPDPEQLSWPDGQAPFIASV